MIDPQDPRLDIKDIVTTGPDGKEIPFDADETIFDAVARDKAREKSERKSDPEP